MIENSNHCNEASVATSAYEAYDLGYMNAKDEVVVNASRNIGEAKRRF
ncbi:MAG: hypothetical protein R2769_05480 [Saprospiraceae bacterium]